ncbi:hypothetical protein [Phytohabitans kaempferiae]|uniref:CMP/dCMP-type deaminase domain-containing protein n=1 Tax=Phytohabitans kaempferiae TaxID=1620943 RepID=A0ABV6MHE2_9ACTN
MTPDEMVGAALAVAEAGLAAGEQPIGAVVVLGGIRREESRELFRRWCATVPDSAARRWAQTLVDGA